MILFLSFTKIFLNMKNAIIFFVTIFALSFFASCTDTRNHPVKVRILRTRNLVLVYGNEILLFKVGDTVGIERKRQQNYRWVFSPCPFANDTLFGIGYDFRIVQIIETPQSKLAGK